MRPSRNGRLGGGILDRPAPPAVMTGKLHHVSLEARELRSERRAFVLAPGGHRLELMAAPPA